MNDSHYFTHSLAHVFPRFYIDNLVSSSLSFIDRRVRLGRLSYYLRGAWRRVPEKKFKWYANVNGWKEIVRRGRKFVVRFGRYLRDFRLGKTSPYYKKARRWISMKPRKLRRRRVPWRRWRRPRLLKGRPYSVMRLYALRGWRPVFRKTPGFLYFRVRSVSYKVR